MASSEKKKSIRQKLTEAFQEKNHFTDALAFVEQETGVNRMYIFWGRSLLPIWLLALFHWLNMAIFYHGLST